MAVIRDTHLPETYFRKFMLENEGFIEEDHGIVESDEWGLKDKYSVHNRIYDMLFETVMASYSAGDDMATVEMHFAAHLAYLQTLQGAREGIESYVHNGYYSYNYTMRLLSLAILFRLQGEDLKLILDEIAFFPVSDVLTETILAKLTRQDQKRNPAPLEFSDTFKHLLNAYEWADMASESALKEYMENWYSNNKDAYWYDLHIGDTVASYCGHWSLETAAAAVLLGVDDKSFRDHPYYPKDWADWARGRG